jgi:hypothetical protein
MVAITLTDEFVDDIDFSPYPSEGLGGSPISSTGSAYFDVALLDTGAAISLITMTADAAFDLAGPYPGETDGFRGTEFIPIGGATGLIEARVSDPLGLYAAGLQTRTGAGDDLLINAAGVHGQTNTSVATLPSESTLPNILGLSFASQYATRIRNSLPQIFELNGKTFRSPAVDFLPLGSGNTHGISRKAPMNIEGASPSTPIYQLNFEGVLNGDDPWENPTAPTVVQGGHFLNVNATNNGTSLGTQQFFFDTGASVTVLSELTALQLGIDVQLDEPDFTIEITGSGGGSGAVPGYYIDQFTILATGGSITHTNVPILVLDVTNPASPGNVVPGIVGTNVLAGRDIIIDPNPSLGGGGGSAGVYISDPVTTQSNWAGTLAGGAWGTSASWSTGAAPGSLTIANVRHVTGGLPQEAAVLANATAWEVNVSGASDSQFMTLVVQNDATLSTFAGISIEEFGRVRLFNGHLDVQFVDIRNGGRLIGDGTIATGSGPVAGQVENVSGVVDPGNDLGTITIEGRYSNGPLGVLEIDVRGSSGVFQHDQLVVNGPAALSGTLRIPAFPAPPLGSSFEILTASEGISGVFETLEFLGATLPTGQAWGLVYEPTSLLLRVTLAGDFDADFDVDGEDLAVWQEGYGAHYFGDGLLAWQRNVGMSVAPLLASVPEPSAAVIVVVGAIACGMRRRRIRGHSEGRRGI